MINIFKRGFGGLKTETAGANNEANPFTAHNIIFDDGTYSMSPSEMLIADHPRLVAAKSVIRLLYGSNVESKSIVDLGCLEGGYTAEFARMGLISTGIDVRRSNIDNCLKVKEKLKLSNLNFIRDDVLNIKSYGQFDAVFCCGLLYHLDNPREFVLSLGGVARDAILINTHYAPESMDHSVFKLSDMTKHEGLDGRWYAEHDLEPGDELDHEKWASWRNRASFWPRKEAIFQLMREAGFDFLFEHVDSYGTDVLKAMRSPEFLGNHRATFVGLRTKNIDRYR